ncbi:MULTISPECIES: DHH family phosphoesterase [Halobacterium]|uniref:DHH/RecJ family phosphoesterase n=3 Tax=Halobacterium salinarum TaxID=2242 RepID=Q9HHX6_HALSA|nr:bifunctional oligoribonuclease/PAP phosphatase NrnA [Halobacterium salinarum]AAG20850.1 Vng6183c [Halobacterium salinarum NRC-1]QRY21638.1 bifunctional oligoribonuclease/PAP phosphatase NrnA [Halobacterium sp. GSL-19]CAP15454.1 DHH/RecJ family phosphoesterase [Halobacterium salinarum R1]MCF2207997.1 bifunctional oligoribonuclease/PAP phosphatase NrnA [Halobacterium salinarum]MCF2240891.1 bifunctional oligoribonuclease/PAP phosphatase NrnA [Halobacterium salinarum]
MPELSETAERSQSNTPLAMIMDDSDIDYQRFQELVASTDSLAILCHDNPDPDTLASALALEAIAKEWEVPTVDIVYGGTVTHQQNRAMINVLDIELTPIDQVSLSDYGLVAFVDHGIPGQNNSAVEEMTPDIIIDHHPTDGLQGQFVDLRPAVGATATLLTRYLEIFSIELEERLATALLFALHRETLDFNRETTSTEHAAACVLHPHADHNIIEELTNSVFTPETISGIGDAIANREVRGSCLVSSLGWIRERDAVPQAADYLLQLEGVSTTIVYGIVDDNVHLSGRTSNSQLHIGNVMEETFDQVGSAGGHHDMAGGQVPLGFIGSVDDGDDVAIDLINQSMMARLFGALEGWTET